MGTGEEKLRGWLPETGRSIAGVQPGCTVEDNEETRKWGQRAVVVEMRLQIL